MRTVFRNNPASVFRNHLSPGHPTIWIIVGHGPIVLAVGAGGVYLNVFTLIYLFSSHSPSLWETVQYRLKYCLKGLLNPEQPTNQPTNKPLVILSQKSPANYPETTNSTENSKCYLNQQEVIGSKYLSGNNLPRIGLIRGKLFPDRIYTLFPPVDFKCICYQLRWLSQGIQCVLSDNTSQLYLGITY